MRKLAFLIVVATVSCFLGTVPVWATAPSITTNSPLPSGEAGAGYSLTLEANGGTLPYTWSLASGSLPPGLNLSSAGVISGTPSSSSNGATLFSVQVEGGDGSISTMALSLVINPSGTLTNGSFETGNFSSWVTSDVPSPFIPLAVRANGYSVYGLFSSAATDGIYSAVCGFGASGSGITQIAQNITVPVSTPYLSFDYRAGWNTQSGTSQSRTFSVVVENSIGSTTLLSAVQLTAPAGTQNHDTGPLTGTVNLSPFAGTTIRICFQVSIPSGSFGSGLFELDNVRLSSMEIGTSSPLPNGTAGTAYSQTLAATGGTLPYTWTLSSGSLPAGLNLTGTGVIAGTPTAAGTSNFTVQVTGANGIFATKSFSLTTVLPPPPTISVPSMNLVSFTEDGGNSAGLIQGNNGNFYGATLIGGSGSDGTVFEMSPGGSLTTLSTFTGANGSYPYGTLIPGSDGNFYGTTFYGGSNGDGTVFKMTPDGTLTSLCAFSGANGANPHGSVVQGSDGNFYGTTSNGGSSNDGTVFMMTPDGSLTTLYSFSGADGAHPEAGVIQGKDGNFYGTTSQGGTGSGYGTVFKITPGGTLTTLCAFNVTNGYLPYDKLLQGSDGNFYGTTENGGSDGDGTVFMMTPSGSLTTLCSFNGTNGSLPLAGLIEGSDGNFYGTTTYGGNSGDGTVFMVTPSGSLTTLFSFTGANGSEPWAGLIQGSDGYMYGTTYSGGSSDNGVIFSFTPFFVTANLGNTYNYQITAGNNPASYGANGLPAGLNINTQTGLISGTPTSAGTFNVTITATNPGGTGSEVLTITVPQSSSTETDTPAMPWWMLAVLALILFSMAARSLPATGFPRAGV